MSRLSKNCCIVNQGRLAHVMTAYAPEDVIYRYWERTSQFYDLNTLLRIAQMKLKGSYVDVGSHVGNHSVFFLSHCPADKVYAIETNPELSRICYGNMFTAINLLIKSTKNPAHEHRFEVLNRTAGATAGKYVTLTPLDLHNTFKSAVAQLSDHGIPEEDRTITLDSIQFEKPVRLIKVSGSKTIDIMAGAVKLLEAYRPVIISEVANLEELTDLAGFLGQFGYRELMSSDTKPKKTIWKAKKKS